MSVQLDSLRRYVANRPPPRLPESPDRVVVVGSGKGGVGTSTIAALLAVVAAADGDRVLLVDADGNHGVQPLLLGVRPRFSVARMYAGEVGPADLLVEVGSTLTLLPLGGEADPHERIAESERRGLLRRASGLYEMFDLVVVDAGSRLEQVANASAAGITRLLAITAAERVSAAATYALIKTMDARMPGLPVDLLFNRCGLSVATIGFSEIEHATRLFLRRALEFAGAIPNDDRLASEVAEGTSLQDAAALVTPATAACHELADSLRRQIHRCDTARADRAREYSPAVLEPRLSSRR